MNIFKKIFTKPTSTKPSAKVPPSHQPMPYVISKLQSLPVQADSVLTHQKESTRKWQKAGLQGIVELLHQAGYFSDKWETHDVTGPAPQQYDARSFFTAVEFYLGQKSECKADGGIELNSKYLVVSRVAPDEYLYSYRNHLCEL